MEKSEVIKTAHRMLPAGAELLYLVEFGSRLYGTATPESDYDYMGIFMPSLDDLVLMKNFKSCQFSTGDNNSKNTQEDYDIQVWSIQYWLLTLIPKMDTVALDVFFSPSNKDAVLFKDPIIDSIHETPQYFINSKNVSNSAYIRYAMSQAKRYGVKGTKLNLLIELDNFLLDVQDKFDSDFLKDQKLDMIADAILAKFEGNEYLNTTQLKGGSEALQICGKYYPYYITLDYFISSIKEAADSYGKRAKLAAQNEGIDWKAISHALRAVYQALQLAATGKVVFPLPRPIREELIAVKTGLMTWDEVSEKLEKGIQDVDRVRDPWVNHYDLNVARRIINNLYAKQIVKALHE